MIIELCANSLEGSQLAEKYGFNRIELNSALELGGLTPSLGLLNTVLENVSIPVVAMLRPRPGGFFYSNDELAVMYKDLDILLDTSIEGVAFGVLDGDQAINQTITKKIIDRCHAAGKKAVFHRAFDVIEAYEIEEATEILIDLGVDRILTSGRSKTSLDGLETLRHLQQRYQDQVDFVIGSGVKPANFLHIYRETEIPQLHGSFSNGGYDITSKGNGVNYQVNPKSDFTATDEDQLAQMKHILETWMSE